MLPKENRLRKEKDFRQVFREGKGVREDGLFLKVRAHEGKAPRIGIVVSKKIEAKAVRRNQIRRKLREAIRRELGHARAGQDMVLVVLPGFRLAVVQDLQKSIARLFQKAAP